MRDALQAGMHADSKFKSRQKMNAAKNIQGLNNISAERLVSPIWESACAACLRKALTD